MIWFRIVTLNDDGSVKTTGPWKEDNHIFKNFVRSMPDLSNFNVEIRSQRPTDVSKEKPNGKK
jgi:vacuolar-type H+-ATPase subunit C/Vma6